jgi:hypothetical protein
MRSPITFIAAALAALLCAAPALAHTLPLRSDGQIPMGFNGSYPLTTIWSNPVGYAPLVDTHVAAEAAAGASVSRTPLYWNNVEGTRGLRNWATYDAIVRADWFQHIKPILLISGAPGWAAPGCTQACVPDDAHLADFQNFVQAAVARYRTLIAGVEIYNEPNRTWYWGSTPDPARYTRVLCAGFRGERAAEAAGSPRVPVAGGALSDVLSTSGGNIAISDYLGGMFAAGAAKCMDALSFHDYPGGSNLGAHFSSVLSAVRAKRDAYAPSMTLWITETGLSLDQTGITEATRTSTLPAIYRTVAAMPDVDVLIYHTLVDTSGTSLNGFGLATITTDAAGLPQFNPTTTYSAIQSLLGSGR